MYTCWYRYACNPHHYSIFDVDVEKCTARIFNSCITKMAIVRTLSSTNLN